MRFDAVPPVLGGRYELIAPIGDGGFAVTYRAHDRRLRREVAVKVLRRQWGSDPQWLGRFEREAQAAAAVNSAYVVPVHDFGVEAGDPYIVMEFVPGGTLRDWLDRAHQVPVASAVAATQDMLRGLAAIHAKGIVHRDVKPQNVLIGENGTARLTDFGIAQFPGAAGVTNTNAPAGTALYMAPEQVLGAAVGPPADLYAAGVVLFEMLAGRPPFTGDEATPLFLAHVQTPPPLPTAVNPGLRLPVALEREVMRALAKDPGERRQSAAAMEAAIVAAMATASGAPVTAPITAPFGPQNSPDALAAAALATKRSASADRQLGRYGPLVFIAVALVIVLVIARSGQLSGLFGGQPPVADPATETVAEVPGIVAPATDTPVPPTAPAAAPTAGTQPLFPAQTEDAAAVPTTEAPPATEPSPTLAAAPPTIASIAPPTDVPTIVADETPTAEATLDTTVQPTAEISELSPDAVRFGAADWQGGVPAPAELERNATAIHGADGAAGRAALRFNLAATPTDRLVLTIVGLGDESGLAFPFGIEVNGLYIGESTATFDNWEPGRDGRFGQQAAWDEVRLNLPAEVFQPGPNEIALISLVPGDYDDRPPYLLLSDAVLAPE